MHPLGRVMGEYRLTWKGGAAALMTSTFDHCAEHVGSRKKLVCQEQGLKRVWCPSVQAFKPGRIVAARVTGGRPMDVRAV